MTGLLIMMFGWTGLCVDCKSLIILFLKGGEGDDVSMALWPDCVVSLVLPGHAWIVNNWSFL